MIERKHLSSVWGREERQTKKRVPKGHVADKSIMVYNPEGLEDKNGFPSVLRKGSR